MKSRIRGKICIGMDSALQIKLIFLHYIRYIQNLFQFLFRQSPKTMFSKQGYNMFLRLNMKV